MKKLILVSLAALTLAATGCSKKADSAAADAPKVSAEMSDSVNTYYGRMVGSYILSDYMRFPDKERAALKKEDILRGVQMALAESENDAVLMGMQIGGQMSRELRSMREQGVEVSETTILKYFKETFFADSLDAAEAREYGSTLNALMTQIQQQEEDRRMAKANAAPESEKNIKAGEQFVAQQKAKDPAIQTSASGLSYKIKNKGEGEITDKSMVTLNYVGTLPDGTVFDQNPDGQPATFSPSGVIPGFSEGLKMLGKGGKAKFYIPGNLAYGPDGVPQANIGPNQMLVFEVEIVDVK